MLEFSRGVNHEQARANEWRINILLWKDVGCKCPEKDEDVVVGSELITALCKRGALLAEEFARARPNDLPFVTRRDLLDEDSGAFDGIQQWDDWVFHVRSCPSCQQTIR